MFLTVSPVRGACFEFVYMNIRGLIKNHPLFFVSFFPVEL